MESITIAHHANILIHVAAGSAALLTGIIALSVNKRKGLHQKTGEIFLVLLFIVILTGLLGVFIFHGNIFLLVITLLSGYMGYSGYRIIKLRSNKARRLDICMALTALSSALYFLYYIKSVVMIWSPVVIYSTLFFLMAVVGYDLLKFFIPEKFYSGLWLYEHIFKMISAFSGLLSAFSGTVFPQFHPYSQMLPSVLMTLVMIGFMIKEYRRRQCQSD